MKWENLCWAALLTHSSWAEQHREGPGVLALQPGGVGAQRPDPLLESVLLPGPC